MVTKKDIMDAQDVLKMQQRKNFLIKFCYWAVIAFCLILPLYQMWGAFLNEREGYH